MNTLTQRPLMNTAEIKLWRDRLRQDLWGSVMPFWASHSHDAQHGGFFNCLDQDGTVFDTTKHIWLQGRQCWMYARLASEFSEGEIAEFVAQYPSPPVTVAAGGPATPTPLTRSNLIAASKAGVDFLLQHAVSKDGEAVYFACARDGTPSAAQRKPFSAAFLTLALGELGVATGEARYRTLALHWLDKYLSWVNSPEGSGAALGKPGLAGAPALAPLNEPMITINLIRELSRGCATPEDARVFYAKERDAAVVALLEHVCREKRCVLEGVGAGGSTDFSSPAGRLINPGHGIEAGWFLLDLAEFLGDKELKAQSLEIIEWTFASGWDGEGGAPGSEPVNTAGQGSGGGSGGMIYFRDALGFTPTQLEAHSKLWWPQAESMIAFAMAFQASGGTDQVSWGRFTTVAEWTYKHLVTDKEWYGYADRTGVVTHRFKGGPYKGCFHVPRAIFLCERALTKVLAQQQSK